MYIPSLADKENIPPYPSVKGQRPGGLNSKQSPSCTHSDLQTREALRELGLAELSERDYVEVESYTARMRNPFIIHRSPSSASKVQSGQQSKAGKPSKAWTREHLKAGAPYQTESEPSLSGHKPTSSWVNIHKSPSPRHRLPLGTMRWPGRISVYSVFFASLVLETQAVFDCNLVLDGIKFDLRPLQGIRTVNSSKQTPPTTTNTTYEISLCSPLPKLNDRPSDEQCPPGTQICAIEEVIGKGQRLVASVIPIAGDIDGGSTDPKASLLKPKEGESGPEGLRVELHGGKDGDGVRQSAEIDLICDKNVEAGQPVFESYQANLLSVAWRTRYACQSAAKEPSPPDQQDPNKSSGSWGFFTWFIIIAFLLIAAYLIFSAFVNYNRYGAVGWDLFPHAEAVRDIPFLVKDYANHVIDTFRGNRVGYSAV